MIHFKRWLLGLATVLAAYMAYTATVAPRFQPPKIKVRENQQIAALPPHRTYDFSHLFPPEAWQRQDPKVIETETCLFLLKDYNTLPDGRMELTPCTAIVYPGSDEEAKRRPIVLDAPGGAIIQFDKELDITRGSFGEVQGGRLPGDIRIFRPASKPGANDALELKTRNVQIDMQRIWTPHEVQFEYGASYGRGRDLTIMMVPRDSPAALRSKGVSDKLQSLQLAVVDVVHAEAAGSGLLGNDADAAAPGRPPKPPQPPVEIRCRGPFLFDFAEQIASFQDQVVITRLNANQAPDQLKCDRVALRMRDAPAATETPATAAPPGGGMSSAAIQSRLSMFEATGDLVTLDVPSNNASASAARIEYDFVKRRLVLMPGPQTQHVELRHGESTFRARQLEYELPETGRLGRLWAEGPGELGFVQLQKGAKQVLRAAWEKELRIRPQEDSKVLSLLGRGKVNAEGLGTFSADEIHLWMKEQVAAPPATGTAPVNASPATAAAGIEPNRLLANGNVEIDAPQILAHSQRFEAWFVGFASPAAGPANIVSEPPAGAVAVSPISAGPPPPPAGFAVPVAEPVRAPDAGLTPAPTAPPVLAGPAKKPAAFGRFDARCDLIRAKIMRVGLENAVEDLALEGQVVVNEIDPLPGSVPVMIEGDIIQLQKGSTPDATLQIIGRPVRIAGRGMKLTGRGIQVHRGDNRARMEGGGEAELPISDQVFAPPGVVRDRPPTVRNAVAKTAKVTWKGDLKFDGQTLNINRNVVVETDLQRLEGDGLSVTFDRFLDFARPQQDRQPQVSRLQVEGTVYLQNRTLNEAGQQVSYDQLKVHTMTVDQISGRLEAVGPGWISSVRAGGMQLPAAPGAPAPPPVTTAAVDKLMYVLVTFEGDVTGNLLKHEVQFQRRVRTTLGPVADWGGRFNPNTKEELGESGILMTSDKLTVVEMKIPGRQWVEFEAAGNTLVEGRVFTASGQRIAYASGKEQLVLEGDGRTDAELWYRDRPDQPHGYQAARKIIFWRLTNAVEIDGAKAIEFNNFNGAKLPKIPGGLR